MTYLRISILLALAGVIVLLPGCKKEKKVKPLLRPVRAVQVFASGGERTRTFSGVAQASLESRLSFKVAGTVQKIHVKVGDTVAAGARIAELDASDYRLQLQQAEASLQSARAQQRNAQAAYDRTRQLYETRSASKNDLDAARAAFESASAQVRALEKQMELAKSQLGYTVLSAPVAGAIASVDVEVNENVRAGQTIVQLSSGSRLEVQITIPEVLIGDIREGQAVTVRFDALAERQFAGRISEVGVAATGMGATYPVTVRLLETSPEIRPGMAAEVEFKFAPTGKRERFVVPSVAVGEDRIGRFVFTVTPADSPGVGVVHRNAVTTGEFSDLGIEILEGLSDGSYVITAGISKLSEGQNVKFEPVQ